MARPTFSERLARALRESNKTQAEIAEAMAIAPSQVSRWKTGKQQIQKVDLRKLAKALGKPSRYFEGAYDAIELGKSPVYSLPEWKVAEELLGHLEEFSALQPSTALSFLIQLSPQTQNVEATKHFRDRFNRRLKQAGLWGKFEAEIDTDSHGGKRVMVRRK